MTSRMLLREVQLSRVKPVFVQHFVVSSHPLPPHLGAGEDPLAVDQNDHDMDSIAGVLKLYFRGLDHALFPKEVFHDLISCVCKYCIA